MQSKPLQQLKIYQKKIESNAKQLTSITVENKGLQKEKKELWDRLTKLESIQLSNNIIITGIQEGPFEPYHTTKLSLRDDIHHNQLW